MTARQFFYSESGALRPLWRILVFVAASVVCTMVAASIVGPIVEGLFGVLGLRGLTTESWIESAGLLAGTAVSLRLIDKRPWSDVWLNAGAARLRLLAFGFAIGACAIALPILALISGHWLRETSGPPGSWIGAALRVSLFLLPAALTEELVTRGYVLSVLRERWGWTWAIVATSLVFGAMHLANAGVTAESIATVTLAGFFLGGIVYVTRSLYAAWMAHFAWNWTMAVLFHTAVSGIPLDSPLYRYVDAGPAWATGGVWGPEGGVPAGIGLIVGIAYLFGRRGRQSRREET